jgi:serine/threonine protein kinase
LISPVSEQVHQTDHPSSDSSESDVDVGNLHPLTDAVIRDDEVEGLPRQADLPIEAPTREVGSQGFADESAGSLSGLDWSGAGSPTASKADSPGASLPERVNEYRIIKLLGSGGMGEVFLAEHVRMQRQVALKVLRGDRMSDEAALERFYDEVRAASRVLHPNVVTAFDAGDFNGIHYLVMEYVDGMTLTKLVSKQGPLSPGLAASIIRQAAMGLLHAHRAGIVHRDVKPGNLIQAKDGTIKVLDLGLAQISNILWSDDGRELGRVLDPDAKHKRKGKLVGTLAYMSPEQLELPDEVDPRSDIYSLGAVLFFLLTARPPYQGEYLDQVYGHRHGEIPDLMQLRNDIDLGFANIVKRMLAKRPSERYASLDEVIEELSHYAQVSGTPTWLAEFVQRDTAVDASTLSGGSTAIANLPVLGIDLGMTYSAVAESIPGVGIHNVTAGDDEQPLFRMAIGDDNGQLRFDLNANQMRSAAPRKVIHCLPMYIGKKVVEREIAGKLCPPEVLLSLAIRKMIRNSGPDAKIPKLAAIAVPASYDQFHRRSIKQASRIAGIDSVRLVDRSVAAAQALRLEDDSAGLDPVDVIDVDKAENILFIGLTGQAAEVAMLGRKGAQVNQLATSGHWHIGAMRWQHRLVELSVEAFRQVHGLNPTRDPVTASRLQMACERALNSLLLLRDVAITVELDGEPYSINVSRDEWLERCGDLEYGIRKCMHHVCKQTGIKPKRIDTCIMLGPLLRIGELRSRLLHKFRDDLPVRVVDRSDVARGAAACLTAELPQRGEVLVPPRTVTSQTIGIVVEDSQGRRRILPLIPRGTSLPARTNRKLTIAKQRDSMTLSVVESSGVEADQWHSLGRYEFKVDTTSGSQLKRTRLIGFELNVDGLLTVRAQTPGMPESKRLPTIPEIPLSPNEEAEWSSWVEGLEL